TSQIDLLLIEDNPKEAELITRTLKSVWPGLKFVHLSDGAEALEYLWGNDELGFDTKKLPSLILLDIKMPKIDGLEVLAKIKAGEITSRIPVVVFTSSAETTDIEKSYLLGANSYIVKPVDFTEYKKVIELL